MLKKVSSLLLVALVLLFLSKPGYCGAERKLLYGIGMTVAGLLLAGQGFQEIEKSEIQNITFDVAYTWTEQMPDEEWDFQYRYDMDNVTQGTHIADIFSIDPFPSSIAYEWEYEEACPVGTDLYITTFYHNHHITYKTVSHNGTKTVTDQITITRKEYSNINMGVAGVCLMSVGVNQIISYVQEQSGGHAKRINPEIKFTAIPGKVYLMAGIRY